MDPNSRLRRNGLLLLAALAATLAGPFLLRSAENASPLAYDRRLVLLSPHNERIRQEIGQAFAQHWKARTGESVYLDWRIPGGSSEIALFLKSEFAGAFQYEWEHRISEAWSQRIASAYADPHLDPAQVSSTQPQTDRDIEEKARRHFLDSSVGIGIDLLFGGGSYDFQQFADAGFLVASSGDRTFGLAAVMTRHPDWFSDQVIPQSIGGEPFRDKWLRWSGVVLASFGIVYNTDALKRLELPTKIKDWQDLANPGLLGQIALADPTKSGSAAKAYELTIQQQMHQALSQTTVDLGPDRAEHQAIREGWLAGLRLIQRISANTRYFTDSAAKIPLEVSRGDAAAGMAIDSYGRATEEFVRKRDGRSRVGFEAPLGGTSISVDAIGMLRGAPDPELATAFLEFVLSPEGQKLWAFRPGSPGGPASTALRRLPVRRDFYTEANRSYMTDLNERPYAIAESFDYRPSWTGPAIPAIRFLIRVMCVDTHLEQREAWRTLIKNGFPEPALAEFHRLDDVAYDDAVGRIAEVLRAKDKALEVRLARELADAFRARYRHARELASAHGHRHE